MAGPWEDFAPAKAQESGPWADFAAPKSSPSTTQRFSRAASESNPLAMRQAPEPGAFGKPMSFGEAAMELPRTAGREVKNLVTSGMGLIPIAKEAIGGDLPEAAGHLVGMGAQGVPTGPPVGSPRYVVPPVPTRYAAGPLVEAIPIAGKALKAKRAISPLPEGPSSSAGLGLLRKYPGKKGVLASETPRGEPEWKKIPDLPPRNTQDATSIKSDLPSGRKVPAAAEREFDQPSKPAQKPGKLEGGSKVARPEAYWPRELEPEVLNNKTTLSRMAHGVAKDLKLDHNTLSDITSQRYGVDSMKNLSVEQYRDLYRHLLGKLEERQVAPVPE